MVAECSHERKSDLLDLKLLPALPEFEMLEFGVWANRWWIPVLFIVVAGHITNVCVTLFLHRAQTHRGVRLHAIAAVPMRIVFPRKGPRPPEM